MPDGYTILLGWDSLGINPGLYPSIPYKRDQFEPISLTITAPQVLLVGSPGHLAGALLQSRANIKLINIPYKVGAPAVADLLAGHVDSLVVTLPAAVQHIRAGRVKAIGVSAAKRATGVPEIPTIAEAGLPDYDLN